MQGESGSTSDSDRDIQKPPQSQQSTKRFNWGCVLAAGLLALFLILAGVTSGPEMYIAASRGAASLFVDAGYPDQALRLLQLATRGYPDSAELHDLLGQVYYDQGDLIGAIASFRRAIQVDPDLATAHNNLGAALIMQGKAAQAIPYLETAISLNPGSGEAYLNLGNALQAARKSEQAAEAYQQGFDEDPALLAARLQWGMIVLRQGKLEQARQAFDQIIAVQPMHAQARLGLGVLALSQENPKEALNQLTIASVANPSDGMIHYYLGVTFDALDLKDQAFAQYAQALELSDDPELVRLLETLLQERHSSPEESGTGSPGGEMIPDR